MTCNLCKAEPCEPWCKYEYPIHQLPVLKPTPEGITEILREAGDHYGVQVLTEKFAL